MSPNTLEFFLGLTWVVALAPVVVAIIAFVCDDRFRDAIVLWLEQRRKIQREHADLDLERRRQDIALERELASRGRA